MFSFRVVRIVQIVDNLQVVSGKTSVKELVEVDIRKAGNSTSYALDAVNSVRVVVEIMSGTENMPFVNVEAGCVASTRLELDDDEYDIVARVQQNIAIRIECVLVFDTVICQYN